MRSKVKHIQIYLFFLCITAFFACKQDHKPDVNAIKLDIKIKRFDRDLFSGKNKDIISTNTTLAKNYGFFYDDFVHRMVGNPSLSNQEVLSGLYGDTAYTLLNHEVDRIFPDLKQQEKELTETFKYIKYYYPKVKVPQFISFLSGFSYQVPIGDNYIGIGLDLFLGKDSKYYSAMVNRIPIYLSKNFTPEYIVPRVTEAFTREEIIKERDEDQNLLSKMVYNGKVLYFLDQVLPGNIPDSIKIGYTADQYNWCQNFEGNIWNYFLTQELIYQSDLQKIQTYITEGPFTPGLGDQKTSAPKLGFFIGWQIVKKYMKENPDITLQQLIAETDAQKILTKSKYKPKEN